MVPTPPLPTPPPAPSPTNTNPPADPSAGEKEADNEPGPNVNPEVVEDIPARALKPVVEAVVVRAIKRETKAVESALSKFANDVEGLRQWAAEYEVKSRAAMLDDLTPLAASLVALGGALDTASLAERHVAVTRADLDAYLTAPRVERAKARDAMFTRWGQERASELVKEIVGGELR